MIDTLSFHRPVLLPQVISYLNIRAGEKYIDATVGGGGYTFEILKRGGVVLGIDLDSEALSFVKEKLKNKYHQWQLNKDLFLQEGNFADIDKIAGKYDFSRVSAILLDLGMSSFQLDRGERGFSWGMDEPLDMRMGKRTGPTAAEILNTYSREAIYEIFTKFSEELNSRSIADAIFRARTLKYGIVRTTDLVKIVDEVIGKRDPKVLSRVFQAIRIAVNDELASLKSSLVKSFDLLGRSGRLAVLSYHSLEDRIVKNYIRQTATNGLLKIVTKRPIRPDREEITQNSRCRSVSLRVAEKI